MTSASVALDLLGAKTTNSSSGIPSILIFVLIGGAFYFLILRPQQRKQKAARAQGSQFDVGDEVVTAGGIVGHVLDITDDRVTLETSVGASFVVLRPYVLRKLEPVDAPGDVVDDQDLEPEPPPAPPSAPQAPTGDAPSKRTPDSQGPTTPPPADDPDGTDATGAGPPIT